MPASDAPVSSATAPPAQSLLEAVLDRWQRPLYTFVCAIVNEDEVARDLVQDTFVAAWRVALRGAAPFGSAAVPSAAAADDVRRWLYHAAYNRAISTWRRGRLIRWRSLDRPTPYTASLAASSVSLEERVADEQAMSQALATLSPPDRACLLLIAVHSFTAAEVGAIVGASAPAITKRYARARQRLRAAYLAQNPPPIPATERQPT